MCRGCWAHNYVSVAACVPYPIQIGIGIGIGIGTGTGRGDYLGVRTASVYGEEPAGGIISTLDSEGAAGACLKC